MHRLTENAFTLIELLVVITIIVVLLSLLAPAMDRVIYRSELVVCAANQGSVARSVVVYAMSNQRFYPARPTMDSGAKYKRPHLLYWGHDGTDDYQYIKDYISVTMLLDPLTGALEKSDFEDSKNYGAGAAGAGRGSSFYADFHLWWNTGYPIGGSKLHRLGGKMTWNDTVYPGNTVSTDLLVSDREQNVLTTSPAGGTQNFSGHPDDAGRMQIAMADNDLLVDDMATTYKGASWFRQDVGARGKLDLNYAFQDGSVMLVDKIKQGDYRFSLASGEVRGGTYGTAAQNWGPGTYTREDEPNGRMVNVPVTWTHIPGMGGTLWSGKSGPNN